jgi:hypothetical protein
MWILQMLGRWVAGSRETPKVDSIQRDQDTERGQNFREKMGGGRRETMLLDRKARDWLFRTGPELTQLSGRGGDRTSRGGVSGASTALARPSTMLFIASPAWARIQEKCRELE